MHHFTFRERAGESGRDWLGSYPIVLKNDTKIRDVKVPGSEPSTLFLVRPSWGTCKRYVCSMDRIL